MEVKEGKEIYLSSLVKLFYHVWKVLLWDFSSNDQERWFTKINGSV